VVVLWLLEAAGGWVVVVVGDWSCAIIDSDIAVAIVTNRNKERICEAPVIDLDEPAQDSWPKLGCGFGKQGWIGAPPA
jgi:hypothetical protein